MTIKEFYENVASGMINADVCAKAQELLDKHEAASVVRKTKDKSRRAEKATERMDAERPMLDAFVSVLSDTPMTSGAILDKTGYAETVKPQKLAHMLKPLVDAGKVEKIQVKIEGLAHKVVGYKLV